MAVISKGTNFPVQLERELFSLVKGHSTLAKLSNAEALPFVGKDIFTFNYSNEISIVGENAQKPAGDGVVAPVRMAPVKVVYQMRVSDEFMYASEEYQMNVLASFADGFAKKLGRGLDVMAMHGVDPKSGSTSSIIGNNCFDKTVTANVVSYDGTDKNIDDACALVEAGEYESNGIALSPVMRGALADARGTNGERLYPEFAFGATPETLGSMALDTNSTVNANSNKDRAIVGDFANCFRWGIAKELPLETIEFGDPDGQGDLKRNNQIVLRSEAFIGWAIMDESAFAIVKDPN